MHRELPGKREEVKLMLEMRRMKMHKGRNSKDLPAENTLAFWERATSSRL